MADGYIRQWLQTSKKAIGVFGALLLFLVLFLLTFWLLTALQDISQYHANWMFAATLLLLAIPISGTIVAADAGGTFGSRRLAIAAFVMSAPDLACYRHPCNAGVYDQASEVAPARMGRAEHDLALGLGRWQRYWPCSCLLLP